MQINLSVWDQYPLSDGRYIDNLYLPYVKKICNNEVIYPYKRQGCNVNENLVRRGWGTTFQLMNPRDPCPEGWTKHKPTGWCVENSEEFNGTFYTSQAFVPYFQYKGYVADKRPDLRISEFSNRSVNPFTGNYVNYFSSKPYADQGKYGRLPSKDSMIC